MKFNIVSDIHLEFYKKEKQIQSLIDKIKCCKNSNIICLLGDIGYPKQELYQYFLMKMLKIYEYVLLVSGNHEFYNASTTHDKMQEKIVQVCDELNSKINSSHRIYYLQKSFVEIDGYIFMGCTLWSLINDHDTVKNNMNDYKKIKKYVVINRTKRKLNISTYDMNNWHNNHLDWLKNQLGEFYEKNKKVIVLTHYAPITTPDIHPPRYRSRNSEAYCTNLDYLLVKPIVAWCYGHTHQEYHTKMNEIQIQSNPLDYFLVKLDHMDDYFTVDVN